MKSFFKGKAAGFYLLMLAAVLAIVSAIYYVTWATANHTMNTVVVLGFGLGIVVNVILLLWDNEYLVIAQTALYSVALLQLLVDSAGSFADAYQGIVMFGDPTQVGTILSIGAIIVVGILATIVAGFIKRRGTAATA